MPFRPRFSLGRAGIEPATHGFSVHHTANADADAVGTYNNASENSARGSARYGLKTGTTAPPDLAVMTAAWLALLENPKLASDALADLTDDQQQAIRALSRPSPGGGSG